MSQPDEWARREMCVILQQTCLSLIALAEREGLNPAAVIEIFARGLLETAQEAMGKHP